VNCYEVVLQAVNIGIIDFSDKTHAAVCVDVEFDGGLTCVQLGRVTAVKADRLLLAQNSQAEARKYLRPSSIYNM